MPKKTIKITIFALLIYFIGFQPLFSLASDVDGTPKIANYYLKYQISDAEAVELAKWDFLILDMENQETSPRQLAKIREINPKIKIVAYITSEEILEYVNSGYAPMRAELREGIKENYWLKDQAGNKLSFWSGTLMLNGSNTGADSWNSYLSNFINQKIKASGYWDGVFLDNLWPDISWFNGGNIDANGDEKKDSANDLNARWMNGSKNLLAQIRAKTGNSFLIIANGQADARFEKDLNGRLLENFPTLFSNGGWTNAMKSYSLSINAQKSPKLAALNTYSKNQFDYRKFRFGLASALLSDGYFSFDYDVTNHGQTWWYDEYDTELGLPQATAYNLLNKNQNTWLGGLWRRDFENGVAIVNSTNKTQTYSFKKENFEKIQGTQDAGVNSGEKTNWVKLVPGDGIILLKKNTEILESAFTNGEFVRVLDDRNQNVQNGYFTYLDSIPGSAQVLITNLNGGKATISSVGGNITITRQGKLLKSFKAYSDPNPNNVTLASADFFGGSEKEIVVGAGKGNEPWIKIFDIQGKQLLKFYAYDKAFRGGVRVAVADLDGDGKIEIVVTPGNGLNSQVKIFSSDGKLKKQFPVFESDFKGGTSVATGDVNADGIAEIMVGAGPGGGPQVAVYNGSGELKSQFYAYDNDFKNGVRVSASDINKDGKAEILAGIINF
ncbi:MAG: putative glycoside hydrolase [Patescibacteria group bacterium]